MALLNKQTVLEHLYKRLIETANNNVGFECDAGIVFEEIAMYRIKTWLDEVQTVDAVPIIRCKDCKHRPWKVYDDNGKFLGVDAPDEMCPCQCEDNWYNWVPDDDWFCANGERKEENGN